MKLATWNINSIRLRLPLVERFVAEAAPDTICFQETKSPDQHFPEAAFEAMGYRHRLIRGMKGYNGVAIVSRLPFEAGEDGGQASEWSGRDWCGRTDCRHAAVRFPDGIELHNLYIPAGGDVPDPALNPKFAHKLQFLDELTAWFAGLAARSRPMALVGDLNIAPLENDVWSHKQLLDVVSHTPIEVEKLEALRQAGNFVDALRHFVPADRKLYSWWSYRAQDWSASDRGRRLDHIWVTPDLVAGLSEPEILREMRGWERASDHVPVIVRLGG